MDMGLQNKTAIVTGAGHGLGTAIALALAGEGVRVTIADVDEEAARRVADQLRQGGGKSLGLRTDVTRWDQVQAMVDQTVQQLGGIDILVNNAGVVGPQGPLVDLPLEGWDRVTGVNMKGVFLCSKAVIPHLVAQRSGKIIHVASCAGKTGEPFNAVYAATKAAVVNLTQSMALELARHNVTVYSVCPYAMDTALMDYAYQERARFFGLTPEEFRKKVESAIPLPRRVSVDDVAKLVVFLASQNSEMLTGQSINVTAGLEVH